LSLIFVVLGIVFTPQIIGLFYPGFVEKGLLKEATIMFRIMFPYLILVSVAGILSTILKAHGRFGVSEGASIFFSVGSIAVVLLLNKHAGLYSMGLGVLFGGLLHILALLPFFWSIFRERPGGIGYRLVFHFASPTNKKYYSQLLPIGGDVLISKTSEIVDQFLASMQIEGAISILSFAKQVFRLPFAIISQAANTVIMRDFSDNLADNDRDRAARLFVEGIKINLFILAPITILMIVLALPLVAAVYQRNSFQSESTILTARALQLYAIGLLGWGLHALTSRIFAARFDIRMSMITNAFMLAVNIALCIILVKTPLGYLGLALATSISYLLFAFLRIVVLVRRMRRDGIDLDMGEVVTSLWKTGIASLLMVVMLMAIRGLFSTIAFGSHWIGHLVTLVSLGFIGVSVYILCSLLLKNTDILIFRKKRNRRVEQTSPELLPSGAFYDRVVKKPDLFADDFSYKTGVYLSSTAWNVRNVGVKLIGLFKQQNMSCYLVDLLVQQKENGFIRRNAVKSLHQLNLWDENVQKGVMHALDDSYFEVRVAAVLLLTDLIKPDDPLVPGLLEKIGTRLEKSGVEEKGGLILLLSRIGSETHLAWLEPFLFHSNSLLRENLLRAYINLFKRKVIDKERLQDCLERVLITSNNMQPSFRLKEILVEMKRMLS
jgi:putative peptidoglycan lipid II flippase